MESHPLPQNVTTFQFKLVGDMTLKQFLYLATGVIIAYILFVFARDKYPFLTWPFIVISASLGAAFAFLPIQARPLDMWVGAFLKAIYTPTKRVWLKDKKTYKDELQDQFQPQKAFRRGDTGESRLRNLHERVPGRQRQRLLPQRDKVLYHRRRLRTGDPRQLPCL